MKKTTKSEKSVKVKEINTVAFGNNTYLYATGEDGAIYYTIHNPATNEAVWNVVPAPAYLTKKSK